MDLKRTVSLVGLLVGVGGLMFLTGWYAHDGQTLAAVATGVMGGSLLALMGVALWLLGD